MNRFFRKIASFTLTELMVVMVISAVVVGTAFSVLTLLQQNISGIETNLSDNTSRRLLEQQLLLDLQRYPYTQSFSDLEQLTFSSPIDSVTYKFKDEYVLRELDTFYIVPKTKQFFFNGKSVVKGNFDALKLSFSEKEQSKMIFLYKRNDAVTKEKNGS